MPHEFTRVVHYVCRDSLRGDISWNSDLLSAQRDLSVEDSRCLKVGPRFLTDNPKKYHCGTRRWGTSSGNSSLTSDMIRDVFPTLAVEETSMY